MVSSIWRVKSVIQSFFLRSGQWIHWFDQQELQNLSSQAGFINWEEQIYKQGVVFRIQKN